jgi:tripartite-type tricarboxylate transporter receptor subunit TctC
MMEKIALCILLVFALPYASNAGESPPGPIKLIVPFSAGGGSDTFARILQKTIRDNDLSISPVVIVNISGAGGTIGSRHVRDAKVDGNTALLLHDGIFTAKYSGKVKYGAEAFEPVAAMGSFGMVLAVKSTSRHQTLSGLLVESALNPDTITYSTNLGAPSHFTGLMLEKAHAGTAFRFVQGGGGAKRLSALLGGHAEVSVFSITEYAQYQTSGLRALAVLAESRHPAFPDIPCSHEMGVEVDSINTQFLWVPKGTKPARIHFLADLLEAAVATSFFRERMKMLHVDNLFLRGEALRSEIAKRDASYQDVDLREIKNAPRLELWVLAGVLFLGLGLLVGQKQLREEKLEQMVNPGLGIRCGIIVVLYVTLLQMGGDFRLSTAAFICILGGQLMGRTPGRITLLAMFSVVASLSLHWLFTGVLVVDLP